MAIIYYAGHSDPGFLINCLQRIETFHPSCFEFAQPSTPLTSTILPLQSYQKNLAEQKTILLCLRDAHRLGELIVSTLSGHDCINDINKGNAKLFIDYSNESGTIDLCIQIESTLDAAGVSNFNKVFFVCQNRLLSKSGNGLQIKVLNLDFFLVVCCLSLNQQLDTEYTSRMMHSIDHPSLKADLLCLNATPRMHRLLLLLYLYRAKIFHPIEANCIVSFPGYGYAKSAGFDREVFVHYLQHHEPDLIARLEELESFFPLVADNTRDKVGNHLAFHVDISHYFNSKLSVVTETGWDSNHVRLTEKTLKPLLLGHPLIVLGHPGTANLIDDLGFRMIYPEVQEQIDNETNLQAKCLLIANTIREFNLEYRSQHFRGMIKAIAFHNIAWGNSGFIYKYCSDLIKPLWCEMTRA